VASACAGVPDGRDRRGGLAPVSPVMVMIVCR
jgi:hypothetical protein